MKKIIRKIVRLVIGAREKENILDCIQRRKYHCLKKINRKKFSEKELEKALLDLGLHSRDTVIVHSAWRSFIGYKGKPESVIELIQNIIGPQGTLLMPAYGSNHELLKYSDPTTAGVIAEIFRKKYATNRSLNTYFSMSASGKNAKRLTENHINSKYYFDEKSPYRQAVDQNAKILLLGLGKKPYKISLFHCVTYDLRKKNDHYANIYSNKKETTLIDEKKRKIKRIILDRNDNIKNNNAAFRKLFKTVIERKNYRRINLLDIYLFDSKEIYNRAKSILEEQQLNIYKTTK